MVVQSGFLSVVVKICSAVLHAVVAPVLYLKEWLHFWLLVRRFPGPIPVPLFGNLLQGGRWNTMIMFLSNAIKEVENKPAAQLWLGPIRTIFLSDPADIQTFIGNPIHERSEISSLLQSTFGKGLITLSGEAWKRHQKIISPAFTVKMLDSFVGIFNRQSDIFVDRMQEHAETGQFFDIEPMIDAVTFDSLCETVMGVQTNVQTGGDLYYFQSAKVKLGIFAERVIRPWLIPEFIYKLSPLGRKNAPHVKEMRRRRDKMIQERRAQLEKLSDGNTALSQDEWGRKKQLAFLDMVLLQKAAGANITDEEIGDEVDTFMLVGYDGLATFLVNAFYALSLHPDVQEKVVEEIRDIFQDAEHLDITPEILKKLNYLEMVIKEVFRFYPPVWVSSFTRAATDVPLVTCDLVIPKGANVVLAMKAAHKKEGYYKNPHVFDPEHFSPENSKGRNPYALIPFSGGKHICIGRRFSFYEAKIILAKTMWRYEIVQDPSFKLQLHWAMATKVSQGLYIGVRPRSK